MKYYLNKYLLILSIAIFSNKFSTAQFAVNLLLNGRPPSYLSDWNSGLAGQLLITYTGQSTTQVKIATQIQDINGTVIAISNNATAQAQNVIKGPNLIHLDKVLQLENMQFRGGGNGLATSGKLSAGQYFLIVQLLDAVRGTVLTQPQQQPFLQVNYQLPFLMYPNDKTWLDANMAQTAITFRWSSLLPISPEPATYRLQVFEVLNTQTPMQALRSNQPILLTELQRFTQYIWRPQLFFKDSATHLFIWTVQTLDGKGIPITSPDENNQGRSEPRTFGIYNKKAGTNAADCGIGYR